MRIVLSGLWAIVFGLTTAISGGYTQESQPNASVSPNEYQPNVADGATGQVLLEGNTIVTGELEATGRAETDVGVRFPDGSVQTTAAFEGGASGNQGFYNNLIESFSPPFAYTEICFKNGDIQFDVHPLGEPTDGGSCLPGDTGFVIEKSERGKDDLLSWTQARANCLMDRMRLLEIFEWKLACEDADVFQLEEMDTSPLEWVSNTWTIVPAQGSDSLMIAPVFGNPNCAVAVPGTIASTRQVQSTYKWRCGR